jgi:hypothetical protein
MSTGRLFPIKSYDYLTGVCGDGRQVVMGLLCPHVVAYFFGRNGELLGDEHRDWITPAPWVPTGYYDIYDKKFLAGVADQIREWQRAIEFRKGTIRIRAFFDDRHPVGICELPEHLSDEEIANCDDNERAELEKSRSKWIRQGAFVWWWARDYYMSRDGEVEST